MMTQAKLIWHRFWRALGKLDASGAEHAAELAGLREALSRETAGRQSTEAMLRESEEAEESQREANHRLRHLVTSNPAVIFALRFGESGVDLSWISDNHRQFTGHDPDENTSRSWWLEHVHPEDRERVIAAEAPSSVGRSATEYRFRRKDGTYFWIRDEKTLIRDAAGTPIELIGSLMNITDLKEAQEKLQMLNSAVEQSKESILITDARLDAPGPAILFVNPAFTHMTGYTFEETLGKTPRMLQGPRSDRAVLQRLRDNLTRGENFEGKTINYRKDGTEFHIEWQVAPIRDGGGVITHFVAIQRDITQRKELETRLFQSQKLETVGKLAGGIAHEFNSIMTAIIGQSELLLVDLPEGNPLRHNSTEIRKAAERAATLTRQLLAYGRKQILQPEILDLNAVVAGMESVLRHLAGRNVNLRIVPSPNLQAVKADAGQIEQVIMNVAMNAIDAMPNGGALTLETANTTLGQEYVSQFPDLKAGEYSMLAITDTGAGMDQEVQARMFDPFFSTKGPGRGTGLGLATSYGILKQSGGHINVYSEPGRGSTLKIYLPHALAPTVHPAEVSPDSGMPGGRETIMLVEDDPALREMAGALLERLGYTVWTAANGIEALSLAHMKDRGHIDLLFTDVVMPHMSGKELSDRMRSLSPSTAVLFTSAYTENSIVHQGVLNDGVALLQKPFTPLAMARKVREMLDKEIARGADRAR